MDLFELIRDDHRQMRALVQELEHCDSPDNVRTLLKNLERCLGLHTAAEEDIIYPAARNALEAQDMIQHAWHEHDEAKDILADVTTLEPLSENFFGRLHDLRHALELHIQQEEGELFPLMQECMEPETIALLERSFQEDKHRRLQTGTHRSGSVEVSSHDLE